MPAESTAQLTIPLEAGHVRTARRVAGAAARRAGVAEDDLDAVRLAVSEACSRATLRAATADHADRRSQARARITMTEGDGWFLVEVHEDVAPSPAASAAARESEELAAALIAAVTPRFDERVEHSSAVTTMGWPIP